MAHKFKDYHFKINGKDVFEVKAKNLLSAMKTFIRNISVSVTDKTDKKDNFIRISGIDEKMAQWFFEYYKRNEQYKPPV